ncbi:MAG: UDP binding domain-containing protein, partial [Vicingaceae bacterium]
SDMRNSIVVDVIKELEAFGLQVEVVDPHASSSEVKKHYNYSLSAEIGSGYDAIVVAVNHNEYIDLDRAHFDGILNPNGFVFDVKGKLKEKIDPNKYLSL